VIPKIHYLVAKVRFFFERTKEKWIFF